MLPRHLSTLPGRNICRQPFFLKWKSLLLLSQIFSRKWRYLFSDYNVFSILKNVYLYLYIYHQGSSFLGSDFHTLSLLLLLCSQGKSSFWSEWTSDVRRRSSRGRKKTGCIRLIHKGDKDLHIQLWEMISKNPQLTVPDFITTWWKAIKINLKERL